MGTESPTLQAMPAHAVAPAQLRRSWSQRWNEARNRLLLNGNFNRWAASFPLTRPIVNREARGLFDLLAGFVYSQVLQACVELDLFATLASGSQTVDSLAAKFALSPDAARRLLLAATSLKLVTRYSDDTFSLGPRGAMILANPGIAAMVRHHAMLYADLRSPVSLLRGVAPPTNLAGYWSYASSDAPASLDGSSVADYSCLMAASQPLVSAEILAAYPIERHRCLLDVGGGDGTFLSAAAACAPSLQLRLFDLPAVAERARARLAADGYGLRTQVTGGSFLTGELPRGADLVSLIRVAYDHDDATVMTLLRAIRRALPDDGTLLIAEPMAGTPGAEPIGEAYFGFYLLAMGSGRSRTRAELSGMARAAGFSVVRPVATRTPMLACLIVCRP